MSIKFISYDGQYPNLCGGVLVVEIDKQLYALASCEWQYTSRSCILENNSIIKLIDCYLCSGGYITDDYDVTTDDWSLDLTEAKTLSGFNFPLIKEYQKELEEVINDNIEHGCCGGCL